ncbi:MAG: hypothetical protein M1819_006405 [Sarea resinae]|nr:MAG: hypothetical protein M1819_006405 [Sarea resinae]
MATSKSALTSLKDLRVSSHAIPAHGLIPNTALQRKPLLIYHSVFPPTMSAADIEKHLTKIGAVVPQWRYTMYSTTHFHSTTHEVLCVAAGRARLCFGGEGNPGRIEPVLEKGDVVIVPAGVGHRLLQELESGYEMVGAYPPGKQWDMCYGKAGEEKKVEAIHGLGWFDKDPLYGDGGPALDV